MQEEKRRILTKEKLREHLLGSMKVELILVIISQYYKYQIIIFYI